MTIVREKLEIPLSKKKITFMLAGSIAFVTMGLWLILKPPIIDNPVFGNPVLISVVGIAAVLFFGLCTFYAIRKLQDNKPGLTIDENGITDNSSGVSAGPILWNDIEKIAVVTIQRQKLIMLLVRNPQHYIDRQTSGFKRKMMALNYKMYGTPLCITSNGLKASFDKLFQLLTDNLNTYRKHKE